VHGREVTLLDVKERPITEWHDTMDVLEHKGVIPPKTPRRNILEMIEKRL
jgi:hypothetical protein